MRLVPMFYVHSIFSWTARAVVDPGYLHCLAGMELDWKKNSPSTEIMRMNSGELYNYLPTQYLMSIQWTLLTVHVAIQSNGLSSWQNSLFHVPPMFCTLSAIGPQFSLLTPAHSDFRGLLQSQRETNLEDQSFNIVDFCVGLLLFLKMPLVLNKVSRNDSFPRKRWTTRGNKRREVRELS